MGVNNKYSIEERGIVRKIRSIKTRMREHRKAWLELDIKLNNMVKMVPQYNEKKKA